MIRRLALSAVVIALVASGTSCLAPGGVTIYAIFADVGDLVTFANVQQADAVVGRVTKLELEGWNARVTMELEPGTIIPQGSSATVRSTSLLGEKFVALIPPPDVPPGTPAMQTGETIPLTRTRIAPELQDVLIEAGGLLASGALADLGAFTSATARIVEGQEENIGRVIDGSQKLIASLASQREALAQALERLGSSAQTLSAGSDDINRFLETSDDALGILAAQRERLDALLVQLDRLGTAQAPFFDRYKDETNRQIDALIAVVGKVHEARATVDSALGRLPDFARLFAEAGPGDYIQLDILIGTPEGLPLSVDGSVAPVFWEATR